MAHVRFGELRRNLAKHLDRVENDRLELVVTRRRREDVVILPLAELESIRETLHLLSSPVNAQRLREGIAQLNAGQGIERDLIEP